jgi:hypothetical protein
VSDACVCTGVGKSQGPSSEHTDLEPSTLRSPFPSEEWQHPPSPSQNPCAVPARCPCTCFHPSVSCSPEIPSQLFFFFFFQPRGLTSKRLPLPFQREALALQRAEALLQHCSGWASSDVHVVGLGTCGRGKEEGIASYWVFPRFLRLHQEPDPPPPQHT